MTPLKEDNYDEETIISLAQGGDRDAFSVIVQRYQARVFRTVLRFMGNYAIAEELTQEIFITVFKKIGDFQGKSKFSSWLYRTTVNHAKNQIGHLSRRGYYRDNEFDEEKIGPGLSDNVSESINPEDYMEEKELASILFEKVAGLKVKEREIIILRDFEGLDYGEISEILKVSRGTVKSRLSRARARLKVEMKDYLG